MPKKDTSKKATPRSTPRKAATRKVTENGMPARPGAARPAAMQNAPRPDEMSEEVLEFIQAIQDYKTTNGRPFPTWSEILEIAKSLGYERRT